VTEGDFRQCRDFGDEMASAVSSEVTVRLGKVIRELFSKQF